jgi:succinate dehydrogenase/fumarate reductase flavoprotein subunit
VAISPAVHFFMGGLRVDDLGQTDLPGVFACGEIVSGLHGANRRGGNALTECAVMGNRVGKNAGLFALNHPLAGPHQSEESFEWKPCGVPTLGRLRELRLKLRETAWHYAGIKRSTSGIQKGLKEIGDLQIQIEKLAPQSVEERRQKEDLLAGTFVTRAILTASQARQESRGSFIREDFPQEDDQHWLKNSCLTLEPGGQRFSLTHKAPAGPNDQPKVSASV